MSQLNCRAGDLAIIVGSLGGVSVGKIVRVLDFMGNIQFFGVTGSVPTWKIEVASEGSKLAYLSPDNDQGTPTGTVYYATSGLAPDMYLRPITPPKDQAGDLMSNGKPLVLEEALCDS